MEIEIDINRHLGKYFSKTGMVTIEIPKNITIAELLEIIKAECNVNILNKVKTDEEVRRYFIVTQDRRFAKLADKVDGKKIKLIPPISGG